MKEVTRTRKQNYIVYVSEPDGEQFTTQSECLQHEKEYRLNRDPKYVATMLHTLWSMMRQMKRIELPVRFAELTAKKTGFLRSLRKARGREKTDKWLCDLSICVRQLITARRNYFASVERFDEHRSKLKELLRRRQAFIEAANKSKAKAKTKTKAKPKKAKTKPKTKVKS